jgi:hypothetical protein
MNKYLGLTGAVLGIVVAGFTGTTVAQHQDADAFAQRMTACNAAFDHAEATFKAENDGINVGADLALGGSDTSQLDSIQARIEHNFQSYTRERDNCRAGRSVGQ